MSIKTTPTTEVSIDHTEVSVDSSTTIDAEANRHCVDKLPPQEMQVVKKEYSVLGDKFFVGYSSGEIPQWLTELINDTVDNAVNNGLVDYDLLVQDVRNAIDSIAVASNTYVEEITFTERVDGIVGTHIATLDATYDGKFATKVELDVVEANSNYAIALSASDLQAEFSEEINSRITAVELAYSSADESLASSVDSLTTAFEEQELNLAGTANAVSGLQTYVGLDQETELPNGFGLLARVGILENQNDGVVEFTANTHDVMIGVDETGNKNDDELIRDALPYVLWTDMKGSGEPTGTTRTYTDYTLDVPAPAQTAILENTFYVREDFTDKDVDKYYRFSSLVWSSVTEDHYEANRNNVKASHIADVYIQYENAVNGGREYIKSYKFIRVDPDDTEPYATDEDGYGWALVTDTDSQAIYTLALEARAMADGKISHFYAWNSNPPVDIESDPRVDFPSPFYPQNYGIVAEETKYVTDEYGNYLDSSGEITTDESEYVVSNAETVAVIEGDNVVHLFLGNVLYRKGVNWDSKTPVPNVHGSGSFIAEGDMLTVFDPSTGDNTEYFYNGSSWQQNGPTGVVSKSKWFVDLDNAVRSPHGLVATSRNELKVESELHANEVGATVENKFSYESTIVLDGKTYQAGFGLDSLGTVPLYTDGTTGEPVFDSTFRINAENFVLTNPNYPSVRAKFNITSSGLMIGLDQTEATKNEPKGTHNSGLSYNKGDMVLSNGSSYIANIYVPSGTPITNTVYWMVLTEKGEPGINSAEVALYRRTETSSTPARPTSGHAVYSFADGVTSESVNNYWEPMPITATTGRFLWKITATASGNDSSVDVPYSAFGSPGLVSESGTSGDDGLRGTAVLTGSVSTGYDDPTNHYVVDYIASIWDGVAPPEYTDEMVGDSIIVTNTRAGVGWTHIYEYTASGWSAANTFIIDGNQIVTGTILGGSISSQTTITAGTVGNNIAGMNGDVGSQHGNYSFWAGASSAGSAPFRVSNTGQLIATNANISGHISATSGSFKGDVTGSSFNGLRLKIGSFVTTTDEDVSINVNNQEGVVYNPNTGGFSTVGGKSLGFSQLVGVSVSHMGPSTTTRNMNYPIISGSNTFTFNRDNAYADTEYFSFIAYGY